MEPNWDELRRREFPVAEQWVFLDHAAVAPLPRRSARILSEWAEDQMRHGVVHWPQWEQRLHPLRDRMAALINASAGEIAFINSTTHGIGLIAEGFPWRDGDNVVTAAEEYPSNIYPWMNLADRGVSVRLVPSREGRVWVEDLLSAMDDRTRVLTISHVEYATGFRNDLDRLTESCHARGVAVFVDAIQGLGPLVLDVRATPIDFLAADGHKWLLGPEGAGLLYVRADWIDRLRPLLVGWNSVVGAHDYSRIDFTLKPDARRWEGGSYAMPALQGLGASLELLHELGVETVSRRILDRAERTRELAREIGWNVHGSTRPRDLSGIVSLEKPDVDPNLIVKQLRQRGVALSCRGGRLRVSPHVHTSDEDLARCFEELAKC